MTIEKQRVRDIQAMCSVPSKEPCALHTNNNTQVPNENTHDAPNEGRAILRDWRSWF